ncbi:cyclophane-forming radical SAM/SPASM peptide maturase GrrM/OscB [Neptunitalea lumnitzerae]|uniref:Radical SAM protein n=1 Tax=Neptunitalea lumnitzerae TaxID=2965509 RepID=A0ABQ5ME94_9FLAO|nr:cyclophane-forming radical SAM/SPASM peptide maturase GrrM/OscB [Neptunitalea sp. Y10]GLB47701.1 radical SAM protein [Neptunitalea sp. Y10]
MMKYGPLDLLIVQGSPFCNINCKYCYLPERNNTSKISLDTISKLFERIVESKLLSSEFTIVWHAGEPLALPLKYYKEIFKKIDDLVPSKIGVNHSFQTNGILINDEWCDFIKENKIRIGISVDGPEFVHDKYRLKRNGTGTHKEVMRGIGFLKKHKIDFHAIAVITNYSLDFSNEIFSFFLDNEIKRVGFNIEEIEGINLESSLNKSEESSNKLRNFWMNILFLQKKFKGKIIIRELESAFAKIVGDPSLILNSFFLSPPVSHLLVPYGIINVDTNGDFSTFSPELLGQKSEEYNDFIIGNVWDNSFEEALGLKTFKDLKDDIAAGVNLCKKECNYFNLCGGGAPSNKYYENGGFKSTETLYCKNTIQIPIDVILENIEEFYHNK